MQEVIATLSGSNNSGQLRINSGKNSPNLDNPVFSENQALNKPNSPANLSSFGRQKKRPTTATKYSAQKQN